jgi:hypothetical protein
MNVHVEQTSATDVPPMPVEVGKFRQGAHPRSGRKRSTLPTARRVGALLSSLVLASVGTVVAATAASAGSDELSGGTRGAAATSSAGDVSTQSLWHVKRAKNVSGGPSRKLVCTYVYSHGGTVVRGKACFQPYGDKFWVQDRRSDGLHVEMRALYLGNFQTLFDCKDSKGKRAGWTACNFSKLVKENRRLDFNVLAVKGNADVKYSGTTVTASN